MISATQKIIARQYVTETMAQSQERKRDAMPDFEKVHHHARTLAALTDPARQDQRQIVMWPVEVAEHWEALATMWQDPLRDATGDYSSPAREITAATIQHDRTELERVQPITIDARFTTFDRPEATKPARKARCGNCGTRYEITDDPADNHHRAMRHAQICPKRASVAQEHARLVTEFKDQPMTRAFARRAEQLLAAGADPAAIRAAGVSIFAEHPAPARRQWWKFWKWFA